MDAGALAAGGIVLLAMVAMSVWGARTLPPGARVPVHHGIGGYGNWQPKVFALVTYPVAGALVFAIIAGVVSPGGNSSGKTAPAVLAPVVLLVIAASQYGALRAVIRANGQDSVG
jgi:hypothetical protein